MTTVPDDLRDRLRQYGQEHVLAFWDGLTDAERTGLLGQIRALDLDQLRRLYRHEEKGFAVPPADTIRPAPVIPMADGGPSETAARRAGEESLARGEVAVLLVAGGQGSRLGFDAPKGMYPVGPVTQRTLFQIHAEKVLALTRRHRARIPFLIMTSPVTEAETVKFFEEHTFFGLPTADVHFFCQKTMPALEQATGKVIMEAPGRIFTSPNGHGGTLTALAESGLLHRLRADGVKRVFYFQVDNPLVNIADPDFLGHHIAANAEVSSKVVAKNGPFDKMGVFVSIDGRCTIIEYSDLPAELARQTDETGRLKLWAGSPAIHVFETAFLARVTEVSGTGDRLGLPFHVARKVVPYLDATGTVVKPAKENAFKFEMFIFDVLPLAERWVLAETSRAAEFAPLKNATGADSAETCRAALSDQAGAWLERAGVRVPRTETGGVGVPIELSPLYALDAAELAGKVDKSMVLAGPVVLAPG